MLNFLHTFTPDPILITIGPINIYWYGLFIVTGILIAIQVILKLAGAHKLDKNTLIDSVFWLITGGIIGARIYHVFLEFPFYINNPANIIKIWQGGLAIHGAIIAGLTITLIYARRVNLNIKKNNDLSTDDNEKERGKNKFSNFWLLTAIYAPAIVLAQAIGRWGNYFNQELFGKPTSLPWGIPIAPEKRITEFFNNQYFHPTFLYESIGSFLIFLILILIHYLIIKKQKLSFKFCVLAYLVLYSVLRFSLEFIRIDITPTVLGLRFPQVISIFIIILALIIGILPKLKKRVNLN